MIKNPKMLFISALTSAVFISPLISPKVVRADRLDNPEVLVGIGNKEEVLRSGRFEGIKQNTSGNVRLFRANNGRLYIELESNFRTDSDADTFVVLSRSSDLRNEPEAGEPFFLVSPLLRERGRQTYILPGDFDPDQFASVAIWSRKDNLLFGAATLK